jgi:hypothetical protein
LHDRAISTTKESDRLWSYHSENLKARFNPCCIFQAQIPLFILRNDCRWIDVQQNRCRCSSPAAANQKHAVQQTQAAPMQVIHYCLHVFQTLHLNFNEKSLLKFAMFFCFIRSALPERSTVTEAENRSFLPSSALMAATMLTAFPAAAEEVAASDAATSGVLGLYGSTEGFALAISPLFV